ncbi:inositol monophosphatase family protein [Hoyosella rhizosphaerae]|uniref:inositol monophosphatase family protein n=1 Tax=Hoyosella rhizosphaerae TaxID=1755582 RepID=UPI001E5EF615|nr:inositol monophosphatase family protein [Hoyosella rhizosphaerae]
MPHNLSLHVDDTAESLRAVAERIALDAADLVRRRRREVFSGNLAQDGAVSSKSTPTDPVTIVDSESEELIRQRLAELRPSDRILGEEGGGDSETSGIRWVVDPIDGTVNFMYGIGAYAVSIAAQRDGVSVAGAVVDVPTGVLYSAALGAGAYMRDSEGEVTTLRCSAETAMSHALVATGFGYGAARREHQGQLVASLLPRIRDIRRIGAASLDLCLLAAGRVDAYFEHGLHPWDWAAAALIASEAGASVTVPSPTSSGDDGDITYAAAPGVAQEFADALDKLGALRQL